MRLITLLATALVIASAASVQTSSGLKLQTRYPIGSSERCDTFAVLVVGK
jgi:hypothetical protein